MGNVNYDDTLDFGSALLTASVTEFPNVINLGETDADRKKADIFASSDIAGGTSVTVTVQGNTVNTTSGWVSVGINTFTLADLKAGKCAVAVSPNRYRCLRAALSKTGTFTAGTLAAQLNTYTGK
jgi:hypothetical protein